MGHDLDILTTWKQENSTHCSKSYSFILGVRISRVVGNAEVTFLNTSDRIKAYYFRAKVKMLIDFSSFY